MSAHVCVDMGKTLFRKYLSFLALLIFSAASSSAFNLTIIHTNDVHARFVEFNVYGGRCTKDEAEKQHCYGGFPRQVSMANKLRNEFSNIVYLNAGDFYQGTIWYTLFKYNVTSKFVNMLKMDAMALGNHEFDDGISGLIPFVQNAEFPILCCNCDAKEEPELGKLIKKSMTMTVGEKEIGIIGYITPDTSFLADSGKLVFTKETECLTEESEKMKSKGINIIIAVGHSGYTTEQEMANEVKDLDVIVGGHSHTFLYSGDPPSVEVPEGNYPTVIKHKDGSKTLVVQDYSFGKYMGFLQVSFNAEGVVETFSGNPILLNATVPQDEHVLNELLKYEAIVREKGKSVIGKTAVLLRGERNLCRMRECNMGNFLADAAVKYYTSLAKSKGWTSVPVAVHNSGGIRASIDEQINGGNVTMEDVLSVAPFQNTIDIIVINGKQFKEMMETSVERYDPSGEDAQGAFLQVSGIRVAYDIGRPPGDRVVQLMIRCGECRVPRFLPLNPEAHYRLAVPSYLVRGGDGFTVLQTPIQHDITGTLDTDIIVEYLKTEVPVTAQLEDRITFIEEKNGANKGSDFAIFTSVRIVVVAIIISKINLL